jgi:hypothetical protein
MIMLAFYDVDKGKRIPLSKKSFCKGSTDQLFRGRNCRWCHRLARL